MSAGPGGNLREGTQDGGLKQRLAEQPGTRLARLAAGGIGRCGSRRLLDPSPDAFHLQVLHVTEVLPLGRCAVLARREPRASTEPAGVPASFAPVPGRSSGRVHETKAAGRGTMPALSFVKSCLSSGTKLCLSRRTPKSGTRQRFEQGLPLSHLWGLVLLFPEWPCVLPCWLPPSLCRSS